MVHRLRRSLRRPSNEQKQTRKKIQEPSTSTSVSSSRTVKANYQTQRNLTSPVEEREVSLLLSRPTIVRRMTSGTLGNDDSIRFDEHRHSLPKQNTMNGLEWNNSNNLYTQTSALPLSATSPTLGPAAVAQEQEDKHTQKPPLLKKPSNCESEDETTFEVCSFSSTEDSLQVRKLPGEPDVAARSKNDPEALKTQEIFESLSEEDKETAARSSWKYFCEFADKEGQTVDVRRRDALARAMIARHLVGEGGDMESAQANIHATLQGRRDEKMDWVRQAWHPSPDWSPEQEEFCAMVRGKMGRWLGPTGRVCILDYDEEDRCNFYHKLAIWTEGTRYHREAILYSASYMLEKAIACSERRSQGRQSRVSVVLDFRGANMRNKNQTLPISIALELAELMKDHYPDRLWTITMIDAPFLARFAWPIFRPFVNHIVQGGVKFVTGRKQIQKTFGPKMLHFDRASNLDMDKFFQLPFDHAYEDAHGHELEY